MTSVGSSIHGREPSERPVRTPHRGAVRIVVALVVVLAAAAGCTGGPDASVGVTVVDGIVEVRAKACDPGGIERIDIVDPGAPDEPVWTAVADGAGSLVVPVAGRVDGYEVTDRRADDALPAARLRVLSQGPDGATWGGPRFRPDELAEGTLRVAGQDVPLAEWEAQEATCPRVTLLGALLGGLATAGVAGILWLGVRLLGRLARRSDPGSISR